MIFSSVFASFYSYWALCFFAPFHSRYPYSEAAYEELRSEGDSCGCRQLPQLLLSLWLSSPASLTAGRCEGRDQGELSWSDHWEIEQLIHADQSPWEDILSVSNLANFLRFSDSWVFMKHRCNNCSGWLQQRLQGSGPDIFWLMPTYSPKNLCVAATIEDDVMRIDDDDETPKVEQIATFLDLFKQVVVSCSGLLRCNLIWLSLEQSHFQQLYTLVRNPSFSPVLPCRQY